MIFLCQMQIYQRKGASLSIYQTGGLTGVFVPKLSWELIEWCLIYIFPTVHLQFPVHLVHLVHLVLHLLVRSHVSFYSTLMTCFSQPIWHGGRWFLLFCMSRVRLCSCKFSFMDWLMLSIEIKCHLMVGGRFLCHSKTCFEISIQENSISSLLWL